MPENMRRKKMNFDHKPQRPRPSANAILLRAVANREKALKNIDRSHALCGPVKTYKDGVLIKTEKARTRKQMGRILYKNPGYDPHNVLGHVIE